MSESDWLDKALEQLGVIERLGDNWDSEGARKPDPAKLDVARKVLYVFSHIPGLPKPDIGPTHDGGVLLEWYDAPRYCEINIEDNVELFWEHYDDRGLFEIILKKVEEVRKEEGDSESTQSKT